MQTLQDISPYAALAAVALSLALLVLVLVLWSSVRRVRRSQLVVMGHHEQRDIVAHVENLDSQVRNLREAVEILTDQLDEPPAGDFAPFPYPSIQEVMQAVAGGEAELAIVPIENSLEGSVTRTLDLLAFGFDELTIVREVTHAIRHQLIARADLRLDEVTKVVSIPIAYGQCRRFIQEQLANVEHEATDSTAEAVESVASCSTLASCSWMNLRHCP